MVNDLIATAAVLLPPDMTRGGCYRSQPPAPIDWSPCPATTELAARLNQGPVAPANSVCRCQNPYRSRDLALVSDGKDAVVRASLNFGSSTTITLDLLFTTAGPRPLISDIRCGEGDATTSIFSSSPTLCST